jgi:hypothetical protein
MYSRTASKNSAASLALIDAGASIVTPRRGGIDLTICEVTPWRRLISAFRISINLRKQRAPVAYVGSVSSSAFSAVWLIGILCRISLVCGRLKGYTDPLPDNVFDAVEFLLADRRHKAELRANPTYDTAARFFLEAIVLKKQGIGAPHG